MSGSRRLCFLCLHFTKTRDNFNDTLAYDCILLAGHRANAIGQWCASEMREAKNENKTSYRRHTGNVTKCKLPGWMYVYVCISARIVAGKNVCCAYAEKPSGADNSEAHCTTANSTADHCYVIICRSCAQCVFINAKCANPIKTKEKQKQNPIGKRNENGVPAAMRRRISLFHSIDYATGLCKMGKRKSRKQTTQFKWNEII